MALGPKELGSWANGPTLSTPNSGDYRGGALFWRTCGLLVVPQTGPMGHMGLMGHKESKEKRREALAPLDSFPYELRRWTVRFGVGVAVGVGRAGVVSASGAGAFCF